MLLALKKVGEVQKMLNEKDKVLSKLSEMIINRNLLKIKIQDKKFSSKIIEKINNYKGKEE